MGRDLKLAVLLSGGGTTLANLLDYRDAGDLRAEIDLVVSSRPNAGGLEIARRAGIRTEVVEAKHFALSGREGEVIRDWTAMSAELDRLLLSGDYDYVCMAGYLCRYLFSPELNGKVLNIHPSLIPSFCGEGMYGHRVHDAVIAAGVRVTGCTVHFADQRYDTGPIILQRCCPVYSNDTAEDVAERVFREECKAYPAVVNLLAEGRVFPSVGGRVVIDMDSAVERFSPYYVD